MHISIPIEVRSEVNLFKLHTLFCNHYLDISKIIVRNPELRTLGIYSNGGMDVLNDILHALFATSESQLSNLTVFSMERDTFRPFYNNLAIYPAFSTENCYS